VTELKPETNERVEVEEYLSGFVAHRFVLKSENCCDSNESEDHGPCETVEFCYILM